MSSAAVGCQPRRCLHHGHVDRVRALRAAKDQNPAAESRRRSRSAVRSGRSRRTPAEPGCLLTNPPPAEERHASSRTSPPPRCTTRASSRLVRPGHRVLLEQQRRDAAQRREQHDRSRAVAADADHQIAAPAREDPPRVDALSGSSASAAQPRPRATCPSSRRCESGRARSPRAAPRALRCPRAVPANVTVASGPPRQQLARDRDARDTDARRCRRPRSRRAADSCIRRHSRQASAPTSPRATPTRAARC